MITLQQNRSISSRASGALVLLACLSACGATANRRMDEESSSIPPPVREVDPEDVAEASATAAPAVPAARVSAGGPQTIDATIATVAGHDIPASDLLELWLFRESPKVRAYLEELVLSNLVLAEAHRLEMSIEVSRLDQSVERSLAELLSQLRKDSPDIEIDSFIQQRLGLNPENYRQRLRRETEIDLLAERCVRAWLLQSERAEVRVIVVDDRLAADKVQEKLDLGGDFAELAAEHSVEDSGSYGGRVPPVVRSDVALSRLAFTTPVGQVGGPVLEQGRYLFLHVDERKAPVAGGWDELRAPVEASLREREIEDAEYWQWKTAMLDRYSVDMTPFLRLVGEPADDAPEEPAGP